MIINKAQWTTDGDNLRFSMPIGKVDQEKRIVSGFATLDNIDKQNDIVSTEASLEAFRKFRGNLREMHQPTAVGKVVSFKEDRYFDPNTKKFYNGVYVSAYVSKGAQDTWEKVLDGTLTGFSIGGNITKSEDEYNVELDKPVRLIKEYHLFELSLVDNPANQFANVISIEKVDGKDVVGGFLAKADVLDVFWCEKDAVARTSDESSESCPSCFETMKNIGFIERADVDNPDTIKFLVDNAKGIRTIKMTKEVNPMTEDIVNPIAEDSAEESVEVTPETQAEEAAEKTVEIEDHALGESPKNESDAQAEFPVETVAKAEDSAPEAQADVVEKSVDATVDAVAEIKNSVTNAFGDLAATMKSLHDQVAELAKSLANTNDQVAIVAKEVADVKGNFNEFGKRVDAVELDTAFRKSGDLGEIVQLEPTSQVQKSLWGERFLKTTDLFR
jgi:hypothetical protein